MSLILVASGAALAGCSAHTGAGDTRGFGFEHRNFASETREKKTMTKAQRQAELKELQSVGASHARRTEDEIRRAGR